MGDESELTDIVSYMSQAMSMSQFVKEFGFGEDVFDFATGEPMATMFRGGSPSTRNTVYTDAPRAYEQGINLDTMSSTTFKLARSAPSSPAPVPADGSSNMSTVTYIGLPFVSTPGNRAIGEHNLAGSISNFTAIPGAVRARIRNGWDLLSWALTPIECNRLEVALGVTGTAGVDLNIYLNYRFLFNMSHEYNGASLPEILAMYDVVVGYAERGLSGLRELELNAELDREPIMQTTQNNSIITMQLRFSA